MCFICTTVSFIVNDTSDSEFPRQSDEAIHTCASIKSSNPLHGGHFSQ